MRKLIASDLPLNKINELSCKYKKQAKAFLKRNKALYTTKTNPWLYEFLYPTEMKVFWTFKGIIRKVKQIVGAK